MKNKKKWKYQMPLWPTDASGDPLVDWVAIIGFVGLAVAIGLRAFGVL